METIRSIETVLAWTDSDGNLWEVAHLGELNHNRWGYFMLLAEGLICREFELIGAQIAMSDSDLCEFALQVPARVYENFNEKDAADAERDAGLVFEPIPLISWDFEGFICLRAA
jgi:hypothetical protein